MAFGEKFEIDLLFEEARCLMSQEAAGNFTGISGVFSGKFEMYPGT